MSLFALVSFIISPFTLISVVNNIRNVKNRIFVSSHVRKFVSFQPFISITKRRLNFVYFHFFYGLFFAVRLRAYLKTFSCAYICAQQYGAWKKGKYPPPPLYLLKKNFNIISNQYICTCIMIPCEITSCFKLIWLLLKNIV